MSVWAYGSSPAAQDAVGVVRQVYDAFDRHDLESVLPLLAPDVVIDVEATARLAGREGPYVGHDGARQYAEDADRVWDELELSADDVRSAGHSVVIFGGVRGVLGGHEIVRRVVWTWRLRDGLVTSVSVSDITGDASAI
ncbi:MAG TPA: nuclear transport factor 2 family protein [Solirubrobacteraceae bacterium]|nr:nuclear transport factor 2 family protein [Solirubrobacteraceae bacterium]